ncbi:MAG: sugar phosphate nucleotidyltransferase [Armatimonadota bacterium]|nr:NTP transferase domain-containing protein [bacterium]
MNCSNNKLKSITKAVVPAAGKGTRLMPLTKAVPKELMPLGKKPVLEHIIDEIAEAGITEVLFVISEEKTAIRTHFGESLNGIKFDYVFQDEQKGLADAIYCAREWVGDEPFTVVLGDSTIETNQVVSPYTRLIDAYRDTDAACVIAVEEAPLEEVSRYGIVKPMNGVAPLFQIDGLVEKPTPEAAPSRYAIAGRYAFDPSIFRYIEQTPTGAKGEYQITDSIGLMLNSGNPIWCVALGDGETRRDIGTFEAYFEAFTHEMRKHNS